MRCLLIILFLATFASGVMGEGRLDVSFYDVGRLYDTIPSNFYDDMAFTPDGRYSWGRGRYERKVRHVASVLDSMQMSVVVLSGVENEQVVRDIVALSDMDYSYLHRTIDYYDGLDFAVLYYGDRFYINRAYTTNHTMVVEGELGGESLTLYLTRVGAKLRTIEPKGGDQLSNITIAWGPFSHRDLERLGMEDIFIRAQRLGSGESRSDMGWEFKSRVGVVMGDEHKAECGVYISRWLLNSDKLAPLPTFDRDRYIGGYSSHLPLYLYID